MTEQNFFQKNILLEFPFATIQQKESEMRIVLLYFSPQPDF